MSFIRLIFVCQAKEDYTDSYVSLSLDEQKESDDLKEHETDIMWTAASLYTGGTDTVREILHIFLASTSKS